LWAHGIALHCKPVKYHAIPNLLAKAHSTVSFLGLDYGRHLQQKSWRWVSFYLIQKKWEK